MASSDAAVPAPPAAHSIHGIPLHTELASECLETKRIMLEAMGKTAEVGEQLSGCGLDELFDMHAPVEEEVQVSQIELAEEFLKGDVEDEQDVEEVAEQEAARKRVAVEVGPIWGHEHAQQVVAQYLLAHERHCWAGQWWTTVPGKMSVIEVEMPAEEVGQAAWRYPG